MRRALLLGAGVFPLRRQHASQAVLGIRHLGFQADRLPVFGDGAVEAPSRGEKIGQGAVDLRLSGIEPHCSLQLDDGLIVGMRHRQHEAAEFQIGHAAVQHRRI